MNRARMITVAAVVVVAIAAALFARHMMRPKVTVHSLPTQTVSAEIAKRAVWQPTMNLVGELKASEGADLSVQVSGIVSAITFQSGDTVKAGTMLLQLNADDQLARLESLKASTALNAIILKRNLEQLKINAVSQATVDADRTNLKNSEALVAQQQALVEQYSLKAPFSGRLGIRNVDLGQYVSAGLPIVTLQALDPIYVDFFIPQQYFSQVAVHQSIKVQVDAYPKREFRGVVTAINPKVETGSRNIKVRASLANDDRALAPGMFVKITLDIGASADFVTVPQTAIVSNAFGNTVFVLDKARDGQGLIAQQKVVRTGQTRGDLVAVESGLTEGELVVVAGQIKLRNGMPAIVNNAHVPKAEANPKVGP